MIQIKRIQKKMKDCINTNCESSGNRAKDNIPIINSIYSLAFPDDSSSELILINDLASPSFEAVFQKMQDASLFAPIFNRLISQLTYSEPDVTLFLRVSILQHLAKKILDEIIVDNEISERKSDELMEMFRNYAINKDSKEKISSFQNFVEVVLERGEKEYDQIMKLETIENIFQFIFDISSGQKEVNKIEFINIKELLLMYGLRGSIVEEIIKKYDGTITFVVSGLTMLTNSDLSKEMKPRLENVLELWF